MSLRDQFPILQREVNGHPLVYLDNAATTQKPQVVLDAMNDYYSQSNANVHRAVHTLAGEATEGYESCRRKLKQRFNADKVIITSGTTEGINLVAHAWGRANLVKGDAIVLTEMEHHSDIVPWQMLAEERGVELRYVPVTQHFTLDMEAFHHALEGAKLVCVVHTSNVLGVRNPLEEIIAASRESGAKVLIDAAQGVPHSTVDFATFGADFMAFSAHKMCGPTGIGALLVQPAAFDEMQPFMGGGDMIETVTVEGSTYQTNEHKFEAGTPRIAEAIGWTAALDWMESFDLDAEHARLVEIASWVAGELRAMGMTVYGRHDEHDAAVVSFLHPTINSEDMAHLLDSRGFAVRTGHHCAQPLLNRLGITGTVRASFYVYNTREEAEGLVRELKEITEKFA
ncbi:MAG: SufS family cysteine desulfurase [Candidatus Poseidoniales archaeon]|nr:MAG: SufS family cysteine desulfurase [Candidatus Poseidoniales archaeon]